MKKSYVWMLAGFAFVLAAGLTLESNLSRVIPLCLALGAVGALARAIIETKRQSP